jgi:hypothetical protein
VCTSPLFPQSCFLSSDGYRTRPADTRETLGAGGKGGPGLTNAVDRDACIAFIRSAVATPSVSKFLLVSALSVRRGRASWFDDKGFARVSKMNNEVMPVYSKAKLAADETLTVLGEERIAREGGKAGGFRYIILRPGGLTLEEPTGRIELGRTRADTTVTRADVADVAARLLGVGGANGWFDLQNGDEDAQTAVERVVKEGINSMDGEDLEAMKANLGKYE